MNPIDVRQSKLIDAMRFPLIVLVVFAHSLGFGNIDVTAASMGWNVYHFFSEGISHNLANLAVCWFYTISGYFFFHSLKEGSFSFRWVTEKWKKRVNGLLIPYLIWNLLLVLLTIIKDLVFARFGLPVRGNAEWLMTKGTGYWFWAGPADFPLYFIRDLMILSLFAPLWYMLVKRGRWISLAMIVFVYASPLNPAIPTMKAIFFFLLGAWLGIWKINMLTICRRFKTPALLMAVVLLLIATYYNSSEYHEWLLRVFYPFAMIAFMNICDKLTSNDKVCDKLINMSEMVFFIFASHEIFILGWTKGLCLRLFGDGLMASWIRYLLVPVVVLSVCTFLYRVFNKIAPKSLAFVCGSRTKVHRI